MKNKYEFYEKALNKHIEQKKYQQLKCVIKEKNTNLINFSSNDYLCLSSNSFVKESIIKYILKWGVGSDQDRIIKELKNAEKKLKNR